MQDRIRLVILLMSLALTGILSVQVNTLRNMVLLNEEIFEQNVYAAMEQIVKRLEQAEIAQTASLYNLPKPKDLGAESVWITRVEEISRHLRSDTVSEKPYSSTELPEEQRQGFRGKFFAKESQTESKGQTEAFMSQFTTYFTHHSIVQDIPLERRKSMNQLDSILHATLREKGITCPPLYAVLSQRHQQIVMHNGNYSDFELQYPNPEAFTYKVQLFPSAVDPIGTLFLTFPTRANYALESLLGQLLSLIIFTCIVIYSFYYTLKVLFRQKKLSEMKNDFVNNMTHEFKTPIATISIATDTIRHWLKAGKPEKMERFLEIIKQENNRMNQQVEKVLQMAQIERREINLNRSSLDMHALLMDACEKMTLQVGQKGGQIQLDLQAQRYQLMGDETHITNVIHNLLDNANKYSPNQPEISLRSRQGAEGELIISVEDKGVGISKEAKKHIFDKFYRVSTGDRHDVKGFGLGLSYVQAIVEAHEGRVEVQSTLGKGSTFSLIFPAKVLDTANP